LVLKRLADIGYTYRFIRMLVMDWKKWDAYKLGIIDKKGKRDRDVDLDTDEKKSAWTHFIRLCANIKRLLQKIPGGGTKLGSFAAALYLIKETYKLPDKEIEKILKEFNIDSGEFLNENSEWFLLGNKQLSPGRYKIRENKILNSSFEEMAFAKDTIKIENDCFPIGDIFGIDIYEATHLRTNHTIYINTNEIYK
tara:strand:- start:1451 stop:2035 length:585 start_codon:yes stop_codon:yes gene_type:complete